MTMKRLSLWVIYPFTFLFGLVFFAPASFLGANLQKQLPKLSYAHISGTFWSGTMQNTVLNTINLGQVTYQIAPLSILTGYPSIKINLNSGAINGSGKLKLSKSKLRAQNGNFRIQLNQLHEQSLFQNHIFGVPVSGSINIAIDDIGWQKNQGCLHGAAFITTDFLQISAKNFDAEGFPLEGPVTCDEDQLLISLKGAGEEGKAQLQIHLSADYIYNFNATIEPNHDEITAALIFAGLQPSDKENDPNTNGSKILQYKSSGKL